MSAAENIIVTKCGHHFHEKCLVLAKERKASCPLCRCALTPLATTLTPVVYYEMNIPALAGTDIYGRSRFDDLEELNNPENPYRSEIAANSRHVRYCFTASYGCFLMARREVMRRRLEEGN